MRNDEAFIRHALDRARRLTASLAPRGHWPLALAVTASLCVSAFGPPAAVHADPPPDPAARLQLFIKGVHIYDDRDWLGSGDLSWKAELCSIASPGLGGCNEYPPGAYQDMYGGDLPFHANSGDDVTLNRLLPARGDGKTSDVTAESGMPVYTGQHYKFHFEMFDSDFVDGDDLGDVDVPVDEGNGWAIGTFTTRSVLHNIDNDGAQGNYAVTWEIRRTLLPDLTVKSVYLQDPLGTPFVCGDIRNVGAQPAPPAELTLSTEGTVLERFRLLALDVGWSYPHCVKRSDLPAKKHNLVFSIDELRELPEMEEFNNVGFLTVEAAEPAATGPSDPTTSSLPPGAGPSPQPGSSGTQADPGKGQPDLTVRAVRVNGQAPDGKNDCKAGRNDLIVVVKNEGAGDAGSFTVRLAVDGDNFDASVDGLDAGREREVRLDNVPLKSGQHALRAVADTEHAITETREDNNELKVSARCQG